MKNKFGFTLVELIGVIIILGVIALITFPIINKSIKSSKEKALEQVINNIEKAAYEYSIENDIGYQEYYKSISLETLVNSGILSNNIMNPVTNEQMQGCVLYKWIEDYKQYEFKYEEDCSILTYQSHYVNYGGLYNDQFSKAIQTSDGNYLAIGTFTSSNVNDIKNYNQEAISTDAMIVKYNKKGEIIWEKKFGGSLNDEFDSLIEVEENGKKYYIVSGWSNSIDYDMERETDPANEYRLFLLKYDESGNIVTKKIFLDDYARISKLKKIDSGYIAVGWYVYFKENGEIFSKNIHQDIAKLSYNNALIMELDEQFNVKWSSCFGGNNQEYFKDIIINDNDYVAVGQSMSIDFDMEGISKQEENWEGYDSIIVQFDKSGNLIKTNVFGGSGNDDFNDIVKVSNGYIATGYSTKNDLDLKDSQSVGAVAVKYDFNLQVIKYVVFENGKDNNFRGLTLDDNKIIAVAAIVNDNNYADGVIYSLDENLNILNKAKFDGGNSDVFNSVITTENGYIVSGRSFSKGNSIADYIDQYSKGNMDAILISYDKNFNLTKIFDRTINLDLVPKEIVKNYGNSIPSPENKESLELYTTNNPSEDLKNWCAITNILYGEKDNYKYADCLRPFNDSDMISVINYTNNNGVQIKSGLNDYIINQNTSLVDISNSWYRLYIDYHYTINSLKLIFNGNKYTFTESVELGYIEPLVIHGNNYSTNNPYHVVQDTQSVLSGGNLKTGSIGHNAYVFYYFKTKADGFQGISIDYSASAQNININHFLRLLAYRNFDISLSKAD